MNFPAKSHNPEIVKLAKDSRNSRKYTRSLRSSFPAELNLCMHQLNPKEKRSNGQKKMKVLDNGNENSRKQARRSRSSTGIL